LKKLSLNRITPEDILDCYPCWSWDRIRGAFGKRESATLEQIWNATRKANREERIWVVAMLVDRRFVADNPRVPKFVKEAFAEITEVRGGRGCHQKEFCHDCVIMCGEDHPAATAPIIGRLVQAAMTAERRK
jgi:hypothetical protein